MLKVITISDIHLGSKRNNTAKIIDNLYKAVNDNPESTDLDIIFLAGDVFDRLLNLKSDECPEIQIWISDLLKFCAKHDIVLRILEGTPSHDWTQSKLFVTTAKMLKLKNLDIMYIDKIHIEHMDKFNMGILYVPDESMPTTEETYIKVKELMRSANLDKVDLAIMHGQFDYQLPAHITGLPRHNSSDYLDIVTDYIFIGHIHTHSINDRIVAQGSFDRLSHGEEEPKGYVKAFISEKDRNVFFIENKTARQYVTINCRNLSLEDTITKIKLDVSNLEHDACVRIEGELKHPIFTNMDMLVRLYPTFTWSKLAKDKDNKNEVKSEVVTIDYEPIIINKENIQGLIKQRLSKLKDIELERHCDELLESLI